jgi:hypothetical protein
MESAKKKSNSRSRSASDNRGSHFAVCVRNRGYRASLELRKLYPVLPDEFADEHQMIRVIDESGEDYLFQTTPRREPGYLVACAFAHDTAWHPETEQRNNS